MTPHPDWRTELSPKQVEYIDHQVEAYERILVDFTLEERPEVRSTMREEAMKIVWATLRKIHDTRPEIDKIDRPFPLQF